MTSVRTLTLSRHERTVRTIHPFHIWWLTAASIVFAVATAVNLIQGDWGDALDGAVLTIFGFGLTSLMRDVNALMGGHR